MYLTQRTRKCSAIRLNLQILFPHTPLCFTSPPFYLARTLVAFFGVCPFLFSHVIFPYQRKQLRAHTPGRSAKVRERKPSAERNILLSISDIACSPASLDCGCEIDISSLAVVKDHLGPARFCQTRFCNIKTRKSWDFCVEMTGFDKLHSKLFPCSVTFTSTVTFYTHILLVGNNLIQFSKILIYFLRCKGSLVAINGVYCYYIKNFLPRQ